MTEEKLYEAMGEIREDYIREAKETANKKAKKMHFRFAWIAAAACLFLAVLSAGILHMVKPKGNTLSIGGIERIYKNAAEYQAELAIEWPWEYKTTSEKYYSVTFGNKEYTSRRSEITESLLGPVMGSGIGQGHDTYTDKTYTAEFEIRSIQNISPEHMIAVCMDGEYYVFIQDMSERPATLGKVLDMYALPLTLELNHFTVNEGYDNTGYWTLTDDTYIWQILSECGDAPLYENGDMWTRKDRSYLTFTATSEALGVYKNVFYITEDGYVATNIFAYQYVYEIGAEAAQKAINYALENSVEADYHPYSYSLAGIVTEITDDAVFIDDSALCVDEKDGITFKILMDDLKLYRYIALGEIKEGDFVVVSFREPITEDYEIKDARSITKGRLVDREILVPE